MKNAQVAVTFLVATRQIRAKSKIKFPPAFLELTKLTLNCVTHHELSQSFGNDNKHRI